MLDTDHAMMRGKERKREGWGKGREENFLGILCKSLS
jgi:hypothetical protein